MLKFPPSPSVHLPSQANFFSKLLQHLLLLLLRIFMLATDALDFLTQGVLPTVPTSNKYANGAHTDFPLIHTRPQLYLLQILYMSPDQFEAMAC